MCVIILRGLRGGVILTEEGLDPGKALSNSLCL